MERSRERGGPPCAKQRGPWGAPLLIPSQLPSRKGVSFLQVFMLKISCLR